jgi:rfaE bifunctional protein kinase chain/domain
MNLEKIYEKTSKLKVLLIGETILDHYIFVSPIGSASKDPILSTQHKKTEMYLGGIFAPARHLSNFVEKVHVISILGENKRKEKFITSKLPKNVTYDFFTKENSPTIHKIRFLENYRNQKLFKIEYNNDEPIKDDFADMIIKKIDDLKDNYDYILINDFGHGFITEKLTKYFDSLTCFVAINVQTNSANHGFNLATKFKKANFLAINNGELRLIYHTKENKEIELLKKLKEKKYYDEILLTQGKQGCTYFRNNIISAPAMVSKPVDTIGAGDAVFALTSMLSFLKEDEKIVPIFANAVGACAVEILGNKESITKEMISKYI